MPSLRLTNSQPPRTLTRCPWLCWHVLFGILASACGFLSDGAAQTKPAESEPPATPIAQPAWGRILPQANSPAALRLEIQAGPADGKLPLPTPFPNITAAYLLTGRQRQS